MCQHRSSICMPRKDNVQPRELVTWMRCSHLVSFVRRSCLQIDMVMIGHCHEPYTFFVVLRSV